LSAAIAYAIEHPHHDDEFDPLVQAVQRQFNAIVANHGPTLFTTDAPALFETFLRSLPVEDRQYHTCNCCRQFVERYGSLAVIPPDGKLVSAMWGNPDAVPKIYRSAMFWMADAVEKASVTGVFLSSDPIWGTPHAGGWSHFALRPAAALLYKPRPLLNAHQAMAAKLEDYRTLRHGLSEYKPDLVAKAVTLLEGEALASSEKFLGPAKFLHELHLALADKSHKRRMKDHLVWRAVGSAPVGFCQPRSSMIGTLLDDLKDGLALETVKRRFAAKVGPLAYKRPTAAPTAGNIQVAERIMAELGLAPALERRFARLDEVRKIWSQRPINDNKPQASVGVFSHLQAKRQVAQQPIETPAVDITFEKFRRTVLPNALRMELQMERVMNFTALLTAVHADAPPIMQWDREDNRNPFSWYVYPQGSRAEQWGLGGVSWVPVLGVTLRSSRPWGSLPARRLPRQPRVELRLVPGSASLRSAPDPRDDRGALALHSPAEDAR
jgi:hypothetical protein